MGRLLLTVHPLGIGLNVLLAPLASDMSFVVEQLSEENPGLLDSAGAYAQAYSIFNSGLAAGLVIGPLWAGFIYSKTNWAIMNGTLAGICALVSVPVVGLKLSLYVSNALASNN